MDFMRYTAVHALPYGDILGRRYHMCRVGAPHVYKFKAKKPVDNVPGTVPSIY